MEWMECILGETRPMERYIIIIIYQLSSCIIVFHACNRLLRISTGKAYMLTWYSSASTATNANELIINCRSPEQNYTPSLWQRFGTQFDLVGPLPETSSGNKYIITLPDYFSKWSEAAPLPSKSAEGVANLHFAGMGGQKWSNPTKEESLSTKSTPGFFSWLTYSTAYQVLTTLKRMALMNVSTRLL